MNLIDQLATHGRAYRLATAVRRVVREPGGTRLVDLASVPDGWVVSLTNQAAASEDPSWEVIRAAHLIECLVGANPALCRRITFGWWLSSSGRRFIDVGVAVDSEADARCLGRVFQQDEICLITPDGVTTVPVEANPVDTPGERHDGERGASTRWDERGRHDKP